ncbi:MAG: type II secretion system protein [Candidatus Andersenbacteria bacterium]
MTLLETVVVITIMSILSVLTAVSFPVIRNHQNLITDAGQVEGALQEAQLRALNEVRPEECLSQAGDDRDLQRRCSNIGTAFQDRQGVLFSDFDGDRQYTPGEDFEIKRYTLVTTVDGVSSPAWQTFVFEALPPTVAVYAGGAVVLPSSESSAAVLTLRAGGQTKELKIRPYGIVE